MRKALLVLAPALLVAVLLGCTSDSGSSPAVHTQAPTAVPILESTPSASPVSITPPVQTPEPTIDPLSISGRGLSDSGREEPHYVDLSGYAVIGYNEESELEKTDHFYEVPWNIPTYTKDGENYVQSDFIEHKTAVQVLEQNLVHNGWGKYSGYLKITIIGTNTELFLNVNNFVTKPYWSYENLSDAISVGYFVAEYHPTDNLTAVDRTGEAIELSDSQVVLIVGKTGLIGDIDSDIYPLKGIVFKKWQNGYGGVNVYFAPETLTLIY